MQGQWFFWSRGGGQSFPVGSKNLGFFSGGLPLPASNSPKNLGQALLSPKEILFFICGTCHYHASGWICILFMESNPTKDNLRTQTKGNPNQGTMFGGSPSPQKWRFFLDFCFILVVALRHDIIQIHNNDL